ncbi:MAG TPA: S41 family peptidase [Actinomycetota bacterium]|nr:S41 family peptidase [Actinomycetota bacterium]
MEPWQKTLTATVATISIALATFGAGLVSGKELERRGALIEGTRGEGLELITDAYRKIVSSSVEAPAGEDLARAAIRGMIKALQRAEDPYAAFFTPQGYQAFRELSTGEFSGIGVWLKVKDKQIHIVSVLPETPALGAGLLKGDVILAVDGRTVENAGTDEAVGLIKGPQGTEVTVTIERAGDEMEFTMTREVLTLPNVRASMSDDIGYVRLFGFARGAGEQLREEVSDLLDEGAQGIVLDLRDNGGGLFIEAIDVTSVFLEEGNVVIYREKGSPDVAYEAEGDAFEEVPLVVLVNEGTASASEIVAGALKDSDRAVLVGSRTYGKGSVQEVVTLDDSSALKLTTAAYLTPSGRNIDGSGIAPDYVVDERPAIQRQRAFDILRGILVSSASS